MRAYKVIKMLKTVRKTILSIAIALPAIFACGAVASYSNTSAPQQPSYALAEEEGSASTVSVVDNKIKNYDGVTYYYPEAAKYKTLRIEDAEGNEMPVGNGVKDAGVYTYYYCPNDNNGYTWADGTTAEKSFTVTINPVTLTWSYKINENTAETFDSEYSVDYQEARNINFISKISAQYGNISLYEKREDFIITCGDEIVSSEKIYDAGEYLITVTDSQNYTNPSIKFTVNQAEVNIGESRNLSWVVKTVSNVPTLNSSSVYCYQYNLRGSDVVKEVYTAAEVSTAPFNNWENWTAVEEKNAYSILGVTAYRENAAYGEPITARVGLNRDSGDFAYYDVEYSGVYEAADSGKYEVVATLKPLRNYQIIYTPSAENQNSKIVSNPDGTYTITKTWYIAYFINEFIAGESLQNGHRVNYTFPKKWEFGSQPSVSAPFITHGDEIKALSTYPQIAYKQPDGYTLSDGVDIIASISGDNIIYADGMEKWQDGTYDLVTFSLYGDGVTICTDQPRKRLSYYINKYTPVGNYTITFKAKNVSLGGRHNDWWTGNTGSTCGSLYYGTEQTFSFAVNPKRFAYDDNLNFFGTDKSPLRLNINTLSTSVSDFFNITEDYITFEVITREEVVQSQTYWSTVVDLYYSSKPELRFRLKDDADQGYYSKDSTWWKNRINTAAPASYYLYYNINFLNYDNSAQNEHPENYYFKVTVYEELELPQLVMDKLQYTGELRSVQTVTTDARYSIADNAKVQKGDYQVQFTITDPVHYCWKGVEGGVYALPWSILDKPSNTWQTGKQLKIPNWSYGDFKSQANTITAKVVDGTLTFFVTSDSEGKTPISGLESFNVDGVSGQVPYAVGMALNALPVGEYYLWATAEETYNYAPFKSAAYTFKVKRAMNDWVTQPFLGSWQSGDTPDLSSLSGASSLYGTPHYKLVQEQDESHVYYDTALGINNLAAAPAGRYILYATVEGDEFTYTTINSVISVLVKNPDSDSDWVVQPYIANYRQGETPPLPEGMSSKYNSTVEFFYCTKSGSPLREAPTQAGEYKLLVIAYEQDGTEITRKYYDFKVLGVSAGLIALVVILGVMLVVLAIIATLLILKRKRVKAQLDTKWGFLPPPDEGAPKQKPDTTLADAAQPTTLSKNFLKNPPQGEKVRAQTSKQRSQTQKQRAQTSKVRATNYSEEQALAQIETLDAPQTEQPTPQAEDVIIHPEIVHDEVTTVIVPEEVEEQPIQDEEVQPEEVEAEAAQLEEQPEEQPEEEVEEQPEEGQPQPKSADDGENLP